jgi:protein-arginine kinase activator protein McsA
MKCQVCEELATVHLTEIHMRSFRRSVRVHYHLCERHVTASEDGSVNPISDEEEKRSLREQLEATVTDAESLAKLKQTMPDLWSATMQDNQSLQRTASARWFSWIRKLLRRGRGR